MCFTSVVFHRHRLPTLHSSRGEHDSPKHCRLVVGLQQPVPRLGLQGLWYRGARVWFQRWEVGCVWFSVCSVVT